MAPILIGIPLNKDLALSGDKLYFSRFEGYFLKTCHE
jgi:hypothetical protein